MTDNKRSRLSALLNRRRRQKVRKSLSSRSHFAPESLEDRVLLASDLTFSPDGMFATAFPNNEFEFKTLDFLPGNLLIKDFGGLADGSTASSKLLYQAKLGLFVDSNGSQVFGTGLNQTGGYEVTAVIEADVQLESATGSVTLPNGTVPSDIDFELLPGGTATIEMYIDNVTNAVNLAGTGFNDGTLFLRASLTQLDTKLDVDDNGGNAIMGLLDQFGVGNLGGQQTFEAAGSTSAMGAVTFIDSTFIIDPISVFQFQAFDGDSTTSAPFQQVNPSLQFEGLAGSTPYVPNRGLSNGQPDGQFQADASASFILKGKIHGHKFHDLDGDGSLDAGEPGMSGVKFELTGVTTSGHQYSATLTSDANGQFWSDDLETGKYTVTEVVPPGFYSTTKLTQTFDVTEGFDNAADPALFGNAVPGSIHGFKCEDLEADGSCSPIVMGDDAHIVFVVDYSGSTKDKMPGVDLNGDGIDDTVLEVEIAAIEATIMALDGLGVNAEVGVVAFNESGLQLDMDPGAGTVLFTSDMADADGNGVLDVIDALRAVTQADVYNNGVPGPSGGLTGGPNGPLTNYAIGLKSAADLLSQWNVNPADGNVIFISDGVPTIGDSGAALADEVASVAVYADTIRAFGINTADLTNLQAIDPMAQVYANPAMLLSIFSFFGGGGVVDNPGLPGIHFELLDVGGNVVDTATTDANGEFWFTDVPIGTYTVHEVADPFFYATSHEMVTISLTSGQEYVWQEGAAKLGKVNGRHVFYNGSAWDGDGIALSAADDGAIAPDKTAFDGTGTADFSNYTSYFRGINGIMVDIDRGMSATGTVSLSDFEFRWAPTSGGAFTVNDATTWPTAAAPTMAVRSLGGGVERYSFSWPNGTLENGWLQVVVKANATTGIQMDDIHYWGNVIGETGNMVGDTMVNAADISGVVNNPKNSILGMATITDHYDLNRDKEVNAADISIIVNHPANGLTVPQLQLLSNPTQQEMGVWKKEVLLGNDLIFANARRTASIHGFKFEDDAVDGYFDPLTEGPFPDIEFGLYDTNDNPILDVDGDHIIAVTDANGEFWFDNLPLNLNSPTTTYRVIEHGHINPNVAGDVFASTHDRVDVELKPGEEAVWKLGTAHLGPQEFETLNEHLIFGNYVTASVHGFKYKDVDMDGYYDPTVDEPWEGWQFVLESDHDADDLYGLSDPDGFEFSYTVTSNADGEFWFENLCPCHYRLREINPYSDVYPTPMMFDPSDTTDNNGNGTPDVLESKMALLFLQSGDEAVWQQGAAMLPGDTLKEEAFFDGSGTLEKAGNGVWDALAFGNFAFSSIHGFKYEDFNVDGKYNPADGDSPLGGILFELVKDGSVIKTGVSNPLGEFWFKDLKPGTYTVRENLDHLGLSASTPTEWTVNVGLGEEYVWRPGAAMLPQGTGRTEILADGNKDPSDDGAYGEKLMFGNVIMGSVHGFKFEDYDGDGKYEPNADTDPNDGRDQNDKPWANFPFEVIGDVDGDGDMDTLEVVTDANGEFWFFAFPGEYTIREKLENVHEDVIATTYPSGKATFFVGSGEELAWREGAAQPLGRLQHEVVVPGLAFGNAYLGSMHGCIFHDVDGDGVRDPEDRVLGGVDLQIKNSAGQIVNTMVTWVDGLYWFDDLPPDTYTVSPVNLPAGATAVNVVTQFVGSREELVHADGAAHLGPGDPQIEVNLGSDMFLFVKLPPAAPAAAPLGLQAAKVTEPNAVTSQPHAASRSLIAMRSRRLLDASLASFGTERENVKLNTSIADNNDNDDLFAILAADRWLLS